MLPIRELNFLMCSNSHEAQVDLSTNTEVLKTHQRVKGAIQPMQYIETLRISNNTIIENKTLVVSKIIVENNANFTLINSTIIFQSENSDLLLNTGFNATIKFVGDKFDGLNGNTGKFNFSENSTLTIIDSTFNNIDFFINNTVYTKIMNCKFSGNYSRVTFHKGNLIFILNNDFSTKLSAVKLSFAGNYTIVSNKINDALVGIYLYDSDDGVVHSNKVVKCYEAIHVEESSNVTIANNFLLNNTLGFVIDQFSTYLKISNNTLLGDIFLIPMIHWILPLPTPIVGDITFENNSVNGKEVLVLTRQSNLAISELEVGELLLFYCTNVSISDVKAAGIIIFGSKNITLQRSIIQNGDFAIFVSDSSDIVIKGNTFFNHSGGLVHIDFSDEVLIYGNNFIRVPMSVHIRVSLAKILFKYHGIGNYWDCYNGSDLDNDMIGDKPFSNQGIYDSAPIMFPIRELSDSTLITYVIEQESNRLFARVKALEGLLKSAKISIFTDTEKLSQKMNFQCANEIFYSNVIDFKGRLKKVYLLIETKMHTYNISVSQLSSDVSGPLIDFPLVNPITGKCKVLIAVKVSDISYVENVNLYYSLNNTNEDTVIMYYNSTLDSWVAEIFLDPGTYILALWIVASDGNGHISQTDEYSFVVSVREIKNINENTLIEQFLLSFFLLFVGFVAIIIFVCKKETND
ncbi:MAG: right-handed parallel beta-helix repeat-containing protein [Candidatus Asgardarchaeia archaeon]